MVNKMKKRIKTNLLKQVKKMSMKNKKRNRFLFIILFIFIYSIKYKGKVNKV